MLNLTKLGKVTKTWCKDGKHRMYVNDLCAVLGIDPKHVKNGEEGRTARELMAAKLWYDVVSDEWVSQGIGQARKEQLIAEILKQTGAEENEPEIDEIEKIEVPEFTAEGKPVPTLNRMPETIEEMEILMKAENIPEFNSKVLFLQGCVRAKQIHNITFTDVKKYQKLFIEFLNQEKQNDSN
jgi:hypothetical protein